MALKVPWLVVAGSGSGSGKTTAVCALLRALGERGVSTAAFKCGPDYIDPMFHRRLTKAGGNLDPFFFSDDTLNYLLEKHGAGRALSVIEGVMGYYDGLGLSDRASTYTVARTTASPVALLLNARGAALSLVAALEGFVNFRPDANIRGVIFNRCPPSLYPALAGAVRERFGERVLPLGYLPPMPDCALESRHLGLVTAEEVGRLDGILDRLGAQAARSLDLDAIEAIAAGAPPPRFAPPALPEAGERLRIAVARDRAFCFYYGDSLALLEDMGAELAPFSPLSDAALPEGAQGLYLGGGYPELYAGELSANVPMRSAVFEAVARRRVPCIAECGGFMYLTREIGGLPMAGALPGTCRDTGHLARFGYISLRAKRDNLLCRAGEAIPAHEFHHWDCDRPGEDFSAEKPNGRRWDCAVATDSLYAGFPHFHFYARPDFAANFCRACRKGARSHG